jgi:histidine ammonia-lyase
MLGVVLLDGESLALEKVVEVARHGVEVKLSPEAQVRVRASRRVVEKLLVERRPVYGVTTGFGALSGTRITPEDSVELQRNLIRSHSAGVGSSSETEVVRATMLLRANTLAKGYSGIRLETLETLVGMINQRVHPIVPEKGSVGASGDLAPLAHVAAVLMGEGAAEYEGNVMPGGKAMRKAGLSPVEFTAKEGLALINGTEFSKAMAVLALSDGERLVANAEIAGAMTLESLQGHLEAFDERLHMVRPHEGQVAAAGDFRRLLSGSCLVSQGTAKEGEGVHDPYSIRCMPQVVGAVRDALAYVRKTLLTEVNSATDNPLVFASDGACISGGNFHGQSVAIASDVLSIALSSIGNIAERRIARLMDPKLNQGLPAFLVSEIGKEGLNSGFMMAQVVAASLASENKVLAHPASVDSLPTSAHFEDHVSMSASAARKSGEIVKNVERIIAIEFLCASQALDLRGKNTLGRGTQIAHAKIRTKIRPLTADREISEEIETLASMIRSGEILDPVEATVGKLHG